MTTLKHIRKKEKRREQVAKFLTLLLEWKQRLINVAIMAVLLLTKMQRVLSCVSCCLPASQSFQYHSPQIEIFLINKPPLLNMLRSSSFSYKDKGIFLNEMRMRHYVCRQIIN